MGEEEGILLLVIDVPEGGCLDIGFALGTGAAETTELVVVKSVVGKGQATKGKGLNEDLGGSSRVWGMNLQISS